MPPFPLQNGHGKGTGCRALPLKPMKDRPPKVRITTLARRMEAGEKITMLTAYDALWASLLDEVGVDVILVGDSLGNVILGHRDTIPVTLDDMVHHTAAARRGVQRAMLASDMPFMTARLSPDETLRNAARLVQEGGAEAVKIEGGHEVVPAIGRIVEAGIPVIGHVGLVPQSIHQLGGYRMRGRTPEEAERLKAEARALAHAGVCSIVLEMIDHDIARAITEDIEVPTIGIGSGPHCDGQVLVLHDLLGLGAQRPPSFVKEYAHLRRMAARALRRWLSDVKGGAFPAA
jgi:3-methyl-2-oxobutanoate hydroxymethyltransferase